MSRFKTAKAMYGEMGIDVDAALAALAKVSISMHCWQGDDVIGFENSGELTGGIAATGNYPGRARNADELFADIDNVFCIYLRTNSDLCHLQHKLICFYNRDEKCLLRGTNWVFK